jgi:hypothetical protein
MVSQQVPEGNLAGSVDLRIRIHAIKERSSTKTQRPFIGIENDPAYKNGNEPIIPTIPFLIPRLG